MQAEPQRDGDPLTVVAVAVVAYLAANVIHEGLGHGGACLLVTGCDPQLLTTAYFESDTRLSTAAGLKWLAAGGTLANTAAGLLLLLAAPPCGEPVRRAPVFPLVLDERCTSGMAWMAQLLGSAWLPTVRVEPLRVERSWLWVGGAALALCAHIAILGRGLAL